MITRGWLPAVGACAAALAVAFQDTLAGGVAWLAALAIACAGLGIAVERITRQRVTIALTLVAGLAVLLVGSMVLAQLGWLGRGAQLATVAVGIAAAALPRRPGADGVGPARTAAAVGGTALLLAILALVRAGAPDDTGQAFLVKRLWDLGTVAGAHRSGLVILGEACAAWPMGAAATGGFGALCASLAIFIVARELSAARAEAGFARLLLALVVLAIVLRPVRGAEWPAVVFHLSAILSLREPIAERRIAWHTLLAALALGLVRSEYWLLATPYAFAALAVPRLAWSRLQIAGGLAAWLGTTVVILVAVNGHGGAAAARAAAILGGLPFATLVLGLLGGMAWRSMLGVMCGAVASYQLAIASRVVPSAMHAPEAVFATWFTVGLAGALAIDRLQPLPARWPGSWLRPAITALAIGLVALTALGLPMFSSFERRQIAGQLTAAAIAWRNRAVFGTGSAADQVHAAQLRIPAGAAITFWGRSASRLEFRRNSIRDAAASGAATGAIDSIASGSAWWIVEDLPVSRHRDPWSEEAVRASELIEATGHVELHDAIGSVRIYHVRVPDAATR